MPVGVQQQVLVVTVEITAEVPHLQFIDKVLTVPKAFFVSMACLRRNWRVEWSTASPAALANNGTASGGAGAAT